MAAVHKAGGFIREEGRVIRFERGGTRYLPRTIGQFQHVERIFCAGIGLVRVPLELGQLQTLRCLDLNRNPKLAFPIVICKLKHLTNLYIARCNVAIIPPDIGRLINLEILNLSHNQIKEIPPQFGNLVHLSHLTCSYNKLASLPKEIGLLKELTYFMCDHNHLESLPDEIGDLTKLQILHISHNKLTKIPNLGRLQILWTIHFENNPLVEFPLEIGLLKGLYHTEPKCTSLGYDHLNCMQRALCDDLFKRDLGTLTSVILCDLMTSHFPRELLSHVIHILSFRKLHLT